MSAPLKPVVGRPYLGVRFDCCGAYQRIYPDAAGTAYAGCCPRCQKPVRVAIGREGTSVRFFRAR
jgi:hypothetical protein